MGRIITKLRFHGSYGADYASLQTVSPGGTGSETVIGSGSPCPI